MTEFPVFINFPTEKSQHCPTTTIDVEMTAIYTFEHAEVQTPI